MKKVLLFAALCAAAAGFNHAAVAGDGEGDDRDGARRLDKFTIAVVSDWPTNKWQLYVAPSLIRSVNTDPDVVALIQLGNIHSAHAPCTSAGVLPPIPTSDPGWNQYIHFLFQQFRVPVAYTPGENEWANCSKTEQLNSGKPLKELDALRSLFFAKPGKSLGGTEAVVFSQAQFYDPAFPEDAKFVENLGWQTGDVVFLTINLPGSNNNTVPWANGAEDPAAQAHEVAARTAADIRWMQAAFKQAMRLHAKAIVIATHADMWDPVAAAPGGSGLSAYTPVVKELAHLSIEFGRPVLLINGGPREFKADHPLSDPSSSTGLIHRTPSVPNLMRITVKGAEEVGEVVPEWLRLTIDTRKAQVFSWRHCDGVPGNTCK